ncbi:hypothetical protein GCM10025876_33060 [Demequina litorisediminis]|uniref:Metallo-beta-lactamase domain-containing protein n=1 Tax=Demequina litorisediminis TaxID=1849022 RepID=A0ABQ6IK68_9MICO|nr:hypothetical protein GCM10025876_33060 [Demequina litorisediminis]
MTFHPEPDRAPALEPGTLRIVPLGGLGEVGRNMTVFEIDGRLLIVDCGVLFPEDHQPGVDLILPDFAYIEDRVDDIEGIVLTHGHEDHIGAVPYLLRLRQDIPIIGSQLTLAFIEAKLQEHRIKPLTLAVKEGQEEQAREVRPRVRRREPLDPGCARGVHHHVRWHGARHGRLQDGPACRSTGASPTYARSRSLGERGVDLFMTDSTNAESPGFTASEVEITPVLDQTFAQATGRIVVASFSSHVHRVQQVINAAHAHGRRVAFVGRSMVRNMNIAADLGYLKVPANILIDAKKADDLPPEKIVYMCTGSQGEPMAALSRIASLDHKAPRGARRPRGARLVAHPRQRECRVPRHQRPDAPGRDGGAPGQRARARVRPRERRRACCTATTSCAPRTSCPSTARCVTCWPTASSR